MRRACFSDQFSARVKRHSTFPARIVVILLGAFLLFALGACSPTPTIIPATSPPANITPNPTPTETPKPTATPSPTPTQVPSFDAKGLDNLMQVDSVMFTGTTKMDITSGYKTGKSQSESFIVYAREPAYYHLYGKTSPYHVSPDDIDGMSVLGIQDGDDMITELYTDDEQQVFSMGRVYQYSNMQNVAALGMGDDYDIAASMDLEYEGWDTREGYGFLQWLGPLRFDGLKRLNEIPCLNYIFDEDDIKDKALPGGMKVTEANGSVCIAQQGNYLVHMDLKMSGENLYLGPPDPDLVKEGEDEPLVEAGSLHHVMDVSQVNQIISMEVPTELFDNVRPPWDIPIFKNSSPVIAITGILNYSHYSFVTNDEPLDVINYYKNEMPALGWKFSAQNSIEGGEELTYKKDDRVYTIWAGSESDQTIIVIENKSPAESYTPDETLDVYDQMVVSPDGKYVAKMYSEYFYPTGVETIEVLDDSGSVLWKIPYQGEMPEGDPHPYLRIYQWSNDSSHLYFYYAFGYDGLPTLWNGFDLQSLDVASGEIKRVLPGEGLMAFAISPEEDAIAYTRMQDEPRRLIIRSLANGQERSSAIEMQSEGFTQAGDISWSPQGDKIFFYTLLVDEEIMQGILVDVKSMEMQTLFEIDLWEEEYSFNGWTENGIEFLLYPGDEVIRFDVNTGKATPIGTATPVP